MNLHINEVITEDHFQGTFQFPNDLDFLNIETEHQCLVDLFNKEIERRNKGDFYYNITTGKSGLVKDVIIFPNPNENSVPLMDLENKSIKSKLK